MEQNYIYINNKRLGLESIVRFLQEGKTLEAIKEVREKTGLNLKESKDLVDDLAKGNLAPYLANPGNPFSTVNPTQKKTASNQRFEYVYLNDIKINIAHIQDLLQQGRKLQAIKEIREETGLGLKESKDLVDNIEVNNYQEHLDIHSTKTTQATLKATKSKQFNAVQRTTGNNQRFKMLVFAILTGALVYFLFT